MSYKIEITADTLVELSGKVLALAAQLNTSTSLTAPTIIDTLDPVMPEVKAPDKPRKAKQEAATEVAEQPVGEPTSSEKPSDEPTPDPTTSSEPTTPPASASEPLDFDKDVAPVALDAVRTKGKPWVQEILAQFGVERASQVPDEQMAEFVAAIRDGGAA